MEERNMKQEKEMEDILSRSSLKENPFGVPAGYFTSMQEEVMEKISATPVAQPYSKEETEAAPATFMTYFKPAFAMAAMFGLVFGIGWGAMKITGTYTEDVPGNEQVVLGDVQGEMEEEDIYSILDITIEDILTADNAELDIPANPTVLDDETIEQYLIDTRVSSTAIALLE